ncbi:MAG: helix-turn-helix domain-containing protein [Clostridia bacterium]|nr:helix-turn-helix domain-containing protein [Clostridia bacterium]
MQIRLGEKIKELRKRDGRKQEDLANALGVTNQAISRWEANGGYPDMEMIPAIANYFGITIDELFGYESDRTRKVELYYEQIIEMNHKNNGMDTCMNECISYARKCLAEFPDDKKLTYALATVLFNAGYVRYAEHHPTDQNGYDVYDTERHRNYHEWQEAIKLYERLLSTLEPGELRDQTIRELLQLYLNIGEKDKASIVVKTLPDISSCRELMTISSCDGKERAAACAEALLRVVSTAANLMISSVIINQENIEKNNAVTIIKSAIRFFELVMPDGNFGIYHASLACINLFLSEHLWCVGDRDGAFEALDNALEHAKKNEICRSTNGQYYTSPAVKLAKIEEKEFTEAGIAANLSEDWPWWSIDGSEKVKAEMQSDPRWNEWVKRTKA